MTTSEMKKSLSIGFWLLALCGAGSCAIDNDSDGMCDVWEARYHAGALLAGRDEDGDGFDNLTESIAGTDPFDAMSHPRAMIGDVQAGNAEITVPTEAGKRYRLFGSGSFDRDWLPVGPEVEGDGNEIKLPVTLSGDARFYRIAVTDGDADGDGVSDWAERQLIGFDPENNDTFASGIANNDLAAVTAIMQALLDGEVTAIVEVADAYEKEGSPAVIELSRSGTTTYPLTVFHRQRGATDPTKSSASTSDYTIEGATPGRVLIPGGSSTAQITVTPVADSLAEVPEELRFDLAFVADDLVLRICDATNIPANDRLFYSVYVSESQPQSPASGYSLIRLQGDNSVGFVSSVFSGLTTPQSAAHIHIKNPFSGPHVESLPMGQLTDYAWSIRAAHFLTTDQAVLDALFSGKLYANVHSELHPSGEIRADYLLTTGSTEFNAPSDPPAIESLAGEELDREIARFLTQSTFGPTPALMDELRELIDSPTHGGDRISAFSAWLDGKLDPALTPAVSLEALCRAEDAQLYDIYTGDPSAAWYLPAYEPFSSSRRRAWWTTALFSEDQVRQRLATALSGILVTSSGDAVVDNAHYGHLNYYDMLAAGLPNTYRELLEGVSTHPIMGQYLSSLRNQKEITNGSGTVIVSPDENFAREIMQLFSIGLVRLHPDGSLKLSAQGQPVPTYGQDDIQNLARLFTGWSFSKRNSPSNSENIIDNTTFSYGNGRRYFQAQWIHPMKQFPTFHDTGEKTILGLAIPAGQTGEAELEAFLDHLCADVNTAPFISRRLIQRLVTSNPSAGYVHRVATVWTGTGGNLTAVAKAILLDYEARSLTAAALVGAGKKKEPLIHYTGLARALQAGTELRVSDLASYGSGDFLASFPIGAGRFREGDTESSLGQTPLKAPSVFNWFYPDYSTGEAIADAGLVVPEFQIATEINTITHINRHWQITTSSTGEAASTLPNYAQTGYGDNADHLIPDVTLGASATQEREKVYMAVMDQNGDGMVTAAGDPLTFNNPAKIREACTALVDHLDLLLCAGVLKADYGTSTDPGNPRETIIIMLTRNSSNLDDNDNLTDQMNVRHERYEKAAYLISISPQSMIQR